MDNQIKVVILQKKSLQIFLNLKSPNWIIEEEAITYKNIKQQEIFEFDVIMPPITLQEEIFQSIMLPKISFLQFCLFIILSLQGYNSAVFAYGATSSGKTYTILGPESTIEQILNNKFNIDQSSGILPRSFYQIVDGYQQIKQQASLQQVTLKANYVEIYNEQIYDLLNQQYKTNNQKLDLKISTIADGPKLIGVREVQVESVNDLMELIAFGSYNRAIGATQFNSRSSRSHVIFTIELLVEWKDKSLRTSKIQFIDLAGSERLAKTVAKGQMLEETKKINQSLHCLGHCIMALSSRKTNKHVPYRDSKLTLLLKECLGGNSNTSFICAVSAALEHEEKTIQTLKFAQRAKLILNKVKINIKLSYEQIEKQMTMLKQELSMMEKILTMNGIKYDKQIFKEQNFQLQIDQTMNIEELTGDYRKAKRRSLQTSNSKSDIKEQFSYRFQQYLDSENSKPQQNSSPNSKRIGSRQSGGNLRKQSLPCSLDGSEAEPDENGEHYLNEAQLIQALKSISETPRELSQFVNGRASQIKFHTQESQYQSSTTNQTTNTEQLKDMPKKRDSCCQVF
ncbi:unnamed protein product [Paramecium primaurelia]|uniref:Kinesin-like protein n=1 Tax=Paramecium primaurelia TaxID=5886 RepID=A0A8S1M2W2_PARPR|nr:unnamed protein product [Paramecium primaurelia]